MNSKILISLKYNLHCDNNYNIIEENHQVNKEQYFMEWLNEKVQEKLVKFSLQFIQDMLLCQKKTESSFKNEDHLFKI